VNTSVTFRLLRDGLRFRDAGPLACLRLLHELVDAMVSDPHKRLIGVPLWRVAEPLRQSAVGRTKKPKCSRPSVATRRPQCRDQTALGWRQRDRRSSR
jgi:hypothetical protein